MSKILLWLDFGSKLTSGNKFYLVRLHSQESNSLLLTLSSFEKCHFNINGQNNIVKSTEATVSGTSISIEGAGNRLEIESGVVLRNATVIIRGMCCSIFIGKGTSCGGMRLVNVGHGCTISIGANCMISDQVEIWSSDTHPIRTAQGEVINPEASVNIGDHVWLGSRTTVLKGVTIGNGSVIGMGSVVTRDVPANTVSVGNPNRTVRENINWTIHHE